VAETLVLTADTFIVLHRTEDLGAEEAVPLWLESTIVDRFRLGNLAERPAPDLLWARKRDLESIELDRILGSLKQTK
jgi:hypothetical protein